jgi:hypothetical protein
MKGFVNICAYFIYLMTLSVAQNIQLRMKQWYMNDELERMWKEAVVV